jgi:uncharacterized protein (DUF1330 family)
MPAYGIANYTIHNPEIFEKYPPAVVPTIQQYSGKFLVADFDAQARCREVRDAHEALPGEPVS